MSELARVVSLARKDARNVWRDGFLLWLIGYPLVLSLLMRIGVPFAGIEGLDLWIAPAAAVLAASMIGMLLGFALIEEHEQDTWVLLRVVPMRERTLMLYLAVLPFALSWVLALACTLLYGRRPVDWPLYLACATAASLTAPVLAMGLAALARDKIQGLALGKILSVTGATPLLIFVLPPAWQFLLFWSPWYWIYLGLLESLALPGELARLALPLWPALPTWSLWVVPALECAALLALAHAALRRRMP